MTHLIIGLALLLQFQSQPPGQEPRVIVGLYGKWTAEPIAGVTVTYGDQSVRSSNRPGVVFAPRPDPGTLTATAPSYEPILIDSLTVDTSGTTRINLYLRWSQENIERDSTLSAIYLKGKKAAQRDVLNGTAIIRGSLLDFSIGHNVRLGFDTLDTGLPISHEMLAIMGPDQLLMSTDSTRADVYGYNDYLVEQYESGALDRYTLLPWKRLILDPYSWAMSRQLTIVDLHAQELTSNSPDNQWTLQSTVSEDSAGNTISDIRVVSHDTSYVIASTVRPSRSTDHTYAYWTWGPPDSHIAVLYSGRRGFGPSGPTLRVYDLVSGKIVYEKTHQSLSLNNRTQ